MKSNQINLLPVREAQQHKQKAIRYLQNNDLKSHRLSTKLALLIV